MVGKTCWDLNGVRGPCISSERLGQGTTTPYFCFLFSYPPPFHHFYFYICFYVHFFIFRLHSLSCLQSLNCEPNRGRRARYGLL